MRRFTLASLVVAAALLAAPSGASAATTVGQTFFPASAFTCNGAPEFEGLQTARASGPSYATPSGGVLTSWSFEAGGLQTVITLRVFRPTGTAHQYQAIADGSELKTIAATSGVRTFPTQISVRAGDFVGIRSTSGTCATFTGNPGDTAEGRQGTATAIGATGTFIGLSGWIYDISAQLEPDCDGDGLGDETQDTNLSSCAPGTGPGTGPVLGPGGTPVFCKGKPATIVGTNGNDVRTGTKGRDVIAGLGGNDTLRGLGGNDLICGGKGKDKLFGGKGKDKLYGQKGKDTLNGGKGKDLCVGGPGKDKAKGCEKTKSI